MAEIAGMIIPEGTSLKQAKIMAEMRSPVIEERTFLQIEKPDIIVATMGDSRLVEIETLPGARADGSPMSIGVVGLEVDPREIFPPLDTVVARRARELTLDDLVTNLVMSIV